MKKSSKKVNPKETLKNEIRNNILTNFDQCEIEYDTDNESYGMTAGTIVVHGKECDLQIKFITPKSGIDRYVKSEEEE